MKQEKRVKELQLVQMKLRNDIFESLFSKDLKFLLKSFCSLKEVLCFVKFEVFLLLLKERKETLPSDEQIYLSNFVILFQELATTEK